MLQDHAPIVSLLQAGEVKFSGGHAEIAEGFEDRFRKAPDGKTVLPVRSGTVELNNNKIIVLAD